MLFLDSRFRIWKHGRNIATFRHIECENEVFELEKTDKDIACYSVSSIDRPVPYDIHNEVYQNRHISIRNIINFHFTAFPKNNLNNQKQKGC